MKEKVLGMGNKKMFILGVRSCVNEYCYEGRAPLLPPVRIRPLAVLGK